MFITLEGPEGAGKSTAISKIKQELHERGLAVVATREPGGSELGKKIRNLLLHEEGYDSRAELLLFLADRAQHVASVIRPALERGEIVLCDRFTDSTVAYQGHARGLDVPMLRNLNDWVTGGLKPDLTLLFDLPVEVGLARITNKDRLDSEPVTFHQSVRNGFLTEMQVDPARWSKLDASASPESVANQALDAVLKKLASPSLPQG